MKTEIELLRDIADAAKEAKESQRTLASVIREKLKDSEANITTIVSPGDGVPEPQQREGGRKKKRKAAAAKK